MTTPRRQRDAQEDRDTGASTVDARKAHGRDGRGAQGRYAHATGFTLVEILMVIAIIALLVTILMPSLTRASQLARAARCRVTIGALTNGIYAYYEDTGRRYFPGQQCLDQLKGDGGPWTGSQWLSRSLFTTKTGTFPGDFPYEAYATYSSKMFLADDRPNYANPAANTSNMAPSDGFSDPKAICYYVSRPRTAISSGADPAASLAQFKEADNDPYTNPQNAGVFNGFITNPSQSTATGGNFPFHDREFLLIAPGIDRKYFTDDDCTNFK